MTRGPRLWILFAAFVVTRVALVYLADPAHYGTGQVGVASDLDLYGGWAEQLVDHDEAAYRGVPIEYPPGSLPFIAAPEIARGDDASYRERFVVLMALVDAAGFAGVLALARRWGSELGPWLWITALALLGPIVYLRLDLVPAVATIWAFERASARGWLGGGAWFGFGAVAKLYPLVLLPSLVLALRDKAKFLAGAAATAFLPLLPLVPAWGDIYANVFAYHSERGIQAESLWGSGLFIALRRGYDVTVGYNYGALHFAGGISPQLKTFAFVSVLAAIAVAAWIASRLERDDARGVADLVFAQLAVVLGVGSVFSPQFLIWLIALAAVAACNETTRLRTLLVLLLSIAGLTHAIFPFLYDELLAAEVVPVSLLWCRNLLVLGAGLAGLSILARSVSVPSTAAPASG